MRTDEQHATPAVTEARIGVEEVGGAVQSDDGLPGTRTAVDDEGAAGSRADDGVLVGLDGAEHVSHPVRPVAAQAGDEGGLIVERGVPFQPVRSEFLVPVVADPAAGPAVPARLARPIGLAWVAPKNGSAAGERQSISGRRPSLSVRPSRPMYTGSELSALTVRPRHRSRPKRRRVRSRVVSRWTSMSRSSAFWPMPPGALRRTSRRPESSAIDCFEAIRDGREALLVAGDQRRVGLGREVVGKVKRAGSQRVHVNSSNLRSLPGHPVGLHHRMPGHRQCHLASPVSVSFWPRPAIVRHDPGLAPSPPVCYRLKVERSVYSPFPPPVRHRPRPRPVDHLAPALSVWPQPPSRGILLLTLAGGDGS